MDLTVDLILSYCIVFCRMGGMVFFNPFLSRGEIPARIRMLIALSITVLIAPIVSTEGTVPYNGLLLILEMVKELFVGFVLGVIFQFFYYMLFFVGDIMDQEFGLSMAKTFDPGSRIQVSLSGNLLQILLVFYFFSSMSHLTMIRIFTSSYEIIPIGGLFIVEALPNYVLALFVNLFAFIIKLGLPFIAASFVVQVGMGVLMKLIPQINVFAINMQLKIIAGLALLYLMSGPVGAFMENFQQYLLHSMQEVLYTLQAIP